MPLIYGDLFRDWQMKLNPPTLPFTQAKHSVGSCSSSPSGNNISRIVQSRPYHIHERLC